MKWSNNEIFWGDHYTQFWPYLTIKLLLSSMDTLRARAILSLNKTVRRYKKINSFKDYESLMKKNSIIFDHENRKKIILNKFKSKIKQKFIENFDEVLLEEVTNIVENPNVILASFDKKYLRIPKEIIISTLKVNQRYFPLFDPKKITLQITSLSFLISLTLKISSKLETKE